MTEKHDVFKDKIAAQALADQLMQDPANPKVTLTQVDRFIVNDMTSDPNNPKSVCDFRNGHITSYPSSARNCVKQVTEVHHA